MSSPISGFTAIPNPQMLAFMPIQSYLMMYFAGSGWQYGKRKISAMSNEQFNKLTPEELLKQHSIELKNMLPTLTKTLSDVTPLVEMLIKQYADFIKVAIETIPEFTKTILSTDPSAVTSLAGPVYQGQTDVLTGAVKAILAFLTGDYSQFEAEARRGHPDVETNIPDVDLTNIFKLPPTVYTHDMTEPHHNIPISVLPTPTEAIAPFQGTKPAAGQSQILERTRLIQLIFAKSQEIKIIQLAINNNPINSSARASAIKQMATAVAWMQARQQELVNLLDRYRF